MDQRYRVEAGERCRYSAITAGRHRHRRSQITQICADEVRIKSVFIRVICVTGQVSCLCPYRRLRLLLVAPGVPVFVVSVAVARAAAAVVSARGLVLDEPVAAAAVAAAAAAVADAVVVAAAAAVARAAPVATSPDLVLCEPAAAVAVAAAVVAHGAAVADAAAVAPVALRRVHHALALVAMVAHPLLHQPNVQLAVAGAARWPVAAAQRD